MNIQNSNGKMVLSMMVNNREVCIGFEEEAQANIANDVTSILMAAHEARIQSAL